MGHRKWSEIKKEMGVLSPERLERIAQYKADMTKAIKDYERELKTKDVVVH